MTYYKIGNFDEVYDEAGCFDVSEISKPCEIPSITSYVLVEADKYTTATVYMDCSIEELIECIRKNDYIDDESAINDIREVSTKEWEKIEENS